MKALIHHSDKKISDTNLPPFEGDGVHDSDGALKRTGGGPSKDWVGEVNDKVNHVKNTTIGKLKKIITKEKKQLKSETDQQLKTNITNEKDATAAIKKDDKIIKDEVIIENTEEDVECIENKLANAEKIV